ncbi:MAG: 4'-phosphopantetheinyl transferase family protein [Anaerolineae bacterium]
MSAAALCERERPPDAIVLPDRACHLWSARVKDVLDHPRELGEVLSPDEECRAARYRFSRPRARFVAARSMLRCVLSEYLGVDASQLRFDRDEGGKPSLAMQQGRGLCFNLAHSGELVLLGLAWRRAVGVDVEQVRSLSMTASVPRQFFSEGERSVLATCDPSVRPTAFLSLWTCKEAYGKARGVGLRPPILTLDDVLTTEGGAVTMPDRWSYRDSDGIWHIQRPFVAQGYLAAVVVAGGPSDARVAPEIEHFTFAP